MKRCTQFIQEQKYQIYALKKAGFRNGELPAFLKYINQSLAERSNVTASNEATDPNRRTYS